MASTVPGVIELSAIYRETVQLKVELVLAVSGLGTESANTVIPGAELVPLSGELASSKAEPGSQI